MRKFGVFSLFLFASILIAGLYGILHDQLTFTISPEYFTKFKYQQFGFDPYWFGGDRQTAAVIGFLATWWTGMIIGLVLGLVGLTFPDHKSMAVALRRAILLVMAFSALLALFGGLLGRFYLASKGVNWWLPENLVDRTAFITVGSIHNFSYLGGLLGMFAAVYFLIRRKRQDKRHAALSVVSS